MGAEYEQLSKRIKAGFQQSKSEPVPFAMAQPKDGSEPLMLLTRQKKPRKLADILDDELDSKCGLAWGTATTRDGRMFLEIERKKGISNLAPIAKKALRANKLSAKPVVGGEEGEEEAPEPAAAEPAAAPAPEVDDGQEATWKKLKAALTPRIPAAIQANPGAKKEIVALANEATGHEKAGDFAAAVASFQRLAEVLKRAAAAPAAEAGPDPALEASWTKLKTTLTPLIRPAVEKRPPNAAAILKCAEEGTKAEKAGDLAAAIASFQRLAALLKEAQAAPAPAPEPTPEAPAEPSADEKNWQRLKAALTPRIQPAIAADPDREGEVLALASAAIRHEKGGDFAAAIATFQELAALLKVIDEEAAEDDGGGPDWADWDRYRTNTRKWLKQLGAGGGPVFISRETVDFQQKGEPFWTGHLVLVGPRAAKTARALKKEGVLFREGTGVLENGEIAVEELPSKLVRGAVKTFKKLRVGVGFSMGGATVEEEEDVAPEPSADEANWKRLKEALTPRIAPAVQAAPERQAEIVGLARDATNHEKAGDFAAAIASFQALAAILKEIAEGAAEGEEEAVEWAEWDGYRGQTRKWLKQLGAEGGPFFVSRETVEFQQGGEPFWTGHLVLLGAKSVKTARSLKKEGILFREGTCAFDGGNLAIEELPSKLVRGASKTFKKLRLGVGIAVGGEVVDDEAEEAAAGGLDLAAFRERYAALDPRLQQALSEAIGDTSKMRTWSAYALEQAEGGNLESAFGTLERLEALVDEALAAGESELDVMPPGLVRYRQTLLAYDGAKKSVAAQIAAFTRKIPSEIPEEKELADELADILDELNTEIGDAVDAAMNASKDEQAPVTAAVRGRIDKALAELGSNALLKHVDQNPFVATTIETTLTSALKEIREAMPA